MICGVSLSAEFLFACSRTLPVQNVGASLVMFAVISCHPLADGKMHKKPCSPAPSAPQQCNKHGKANISGNAFCRAGASHRPLRRRPKRIKTTGSQVKLRSSMVQSLSTCEMNCQARWLPAANGYDATDSKSARPKCPKRLNLRTMLASAMDMVGKS